MYLANKEGTCSYNKHKVIVNLQVAFERSVQSYTYRLTQ